MIRNLISSRFLLSTNLPTQGFRFLYTADALSLEGYLESRKRTKLQFHTQQMQDNFRERMKTFLKSDSSNLIFSEDLKNLAHLAEGTPEDIAIVNEMTERYAIQSQGAKIGVFTFGPVIMRFFYHANKPVEALNMLKNPQTVDMFDQFISYQLVMDLLVENKMYDEALEAFSIIQSRAIKGDRFPKNCFVLAMYALYSQNTPEAFEKMKQLLIGAQEQQYPPMRRSLTFAAALALKQGHPDVALNILSSCRQNNYVTVRNMKVLVFAKFDRLQDAFTILRTSVDYDTPEEHKRTVLKEVLQAVREAANASGDKQMQLEFSSIEKALVSKKLVDEQTLHSLLTVPIDRFLPPDQKTWGSQGSQFDRYSNRGGYSQGNQRDRRGSDSRSGFDYPRRRPGLSDME